MVKMAVPPVRSSDSLRAVLLSAKSPSGGSGSKPGSSALTWHSLRSVGPTGASDPPGHYFPAKLSLAMGLVKIFFSLLMMGLGAVAIVMKASISSVGAGVWVGVIVGVSGFLGVCAARRPYIHVYVISFLSVSIVSLAASGLLVVLSAAAWARDNETPQIILYDKETRSEVDLLGHFLVRRPSILVSGLLVVLGVFDILISLACVALSAREACGTSSSHMGVFATHDGHDKKERLYRWLGQQKTIFQVTSNSNGPKNITSVSQFVPLTTGGDPTSSKKRSPHVSSTVGPILHSIQKPQKKPSPGPSGKSGSPSSGESSDPLHEKKTSKSSKKNSSVIFLHPEIDYDLKEPILVKRKQKGSKKPSHMQEPYSLPPVMPVDGYHGHPRDGNNLYGNPWAPPAHFVPLAPQDLYVQARAQPAFHSLPCSQHQFYAQHPQRFYAPRPNPMSPRMSPIKIRQKEENRELNKMYRKNERKREKAMRKKKEAKQKRREEREKRRNLPLTDQQIEKSYTGLDREIAEGFISLTMEPSASRRKSHLSTSEESF